MFPFQESATVAAINKTTYAAGGAAFFLGMTANETAAIGGLLIAFIALIVNTAMSWYFKSQHLKLAKLHASNLTEEEDE